MPTPLITPLPNPPSRSQSPETFSVDADAFLGALPEFQTDANAQATYLDALAIGVDADAVTASNAAAVAAGAANYVGDYSAGTTYQIGQSVSYLGRRYVAKTVNTGVTPAEGANWFLINDGDVLGPISATNNALAAFDGTTGKMIKVAATVDVAQGGTGATSLTANAVLVGNGTSAISSVAPSTAGNLLTSNGTSWVSQAAPPRGSSLTAIATGNLADGSPVVVNANGTVSIVAGETQLLGAIANANSTTANKTCGTYDATAQRVIICYADGNNSSFGTAVVGTISGTTITFGTPVVFASANTANTMSVCYHTAQQRVVITYNNGASSNRPTAIVGTVSGTTISFGTAVQFGTLTNTQVMNTIYHPIQQRVVVFWRDSSTLYVIVASVSGTTISFGTAGTFGDVSGTNLIENGSVAYDSNQNRILVTYQSGNQGFIAAVEVVGLAFSFGTGVFITNQATPTVGYDSVEQRAIISYQSITTPFPRFVVLATVSGFTITLGTPVDTSAFMSGSPHRISYDANARRVLFYGLNGTQSELVPAMISANTITFFPKIIVSTNSEAPGLIYCQPINRVVVLGRTGVSPFNATAAVFRHQFSNLTSGNFIGFSDGSFTNGQTATVQLVGAVDDAQTGLTAGRSYFVQLNGGIGLTASDPSVFAGTAVTASRIIVKG